MTVKEQAMLTEEEISECDQKMLPNVDQANDECKMGFQRKQHWQNYGVGYHITLLLPAGAAWQNIYLHSIAFHLPA